MWELLQKISHGRICLRTVSLLLTSFVVATFLCSSVIDSTAYALDATRSGTSLVYNGHTFTGSENIKTGDIRGLPEGTHVYEYINTQTNKREYLFIASTVDVTTATSATYVTYNFTPPAMYSNPSPSPPATVTITAKPVDGVAGTTCSSDVMSGIGWILCPVSYWLAKSVDAIYGVVASFLRVAPLTNSTDNGIYPLWSVIRSFANVCFVIAFLIVIYSQITNYGITNYGIKSMLPRLVIAAILVNVSYWVCAIAIDATNLLGFGIQQLLISIRESMPAGADVSWSNMTNYILSGGTATAGFLWFSAATAGSLSAAGFLLIATLASAGLSIMVAFIILAARQAIITVLVIISPLAFVAYVLPSTEKWFTKWRSTITTLLFMFPIFSLLFGGSQLAGMAIMKNSNGQLSIVLIGMATQIVPLIVTPMLVKLSSGLLGTIANMSNDKKRGLVDRTKGWAQNSADYHKDKALGKDKVKPWRLAHRTARAFDRQGKVMAHNRKAFQQAAENHAMASPKYMKADEFVRDTEREKQRLQHGLDANWSQKINVNPTHLKKEVEMRLAGEKAKAAQEKTDTIFSEFRTGKAPIKMPHLQPLADQAHLNAEEMALTGIRKRQAEESLSVKINKELLGNGAIKDANDVTIGYREIDGLSLQDYAKGVGHHEIMLASEVAKSRKEWNERAGAMGQLARHFKLNNEQYQELAKTASGAVTARDGSGNAYTFDASNEYVKEMAITEQFNAGSYGQKMEIIMESGAYTDAAGNLVTGANYDHRVTIQSEAVRTGIQRQAPFINDVTFDAIIKGEVYGEKSLRMHALRQIVQGRVKGETISGANNVALEMMFDTDEMRSNPARAAEFDELKKMYLDSIDDPRNPSIRASAAAGFDATFAANYLTMREQAYEVLHSDILSKDANANSKAVFKKYAVAPPPA